jgi:hypothetical protein
MDIWSIAKAGEAGGSNAVNSDEEGEGNIV